MSQIISVTGSNKKLLQQVRFLIYKANSAADKNNWMQFKKFSDFAEIKLSRIALNLKISRNKYYIVPSKFSDAVVLVPKEGQA